MDSRNRNGIYFRHYFSLKEAPCGSGGREKKKTVIFILSLPVT